MRPALALGEALRPSNCRLQLTVTGLHVRGVVGNKAGRGIVVGEAADVALIELTQQRNQPMTTTTRIGLGLSTALVSLSLAFAPAAFAQDKMGKDDGMKKESMSKDAMKKDDGMTKKDGMKHDGMMKDGMKKDDGMKKN
jgi:pentapeptide MXKDX repeat protein